MKKLFPQFDTTVRSDDRSAWRDATFVFDAPALLALCTSPDITRRNLLQFMETIKPQLWIAHQSALDFQRNWSGHIARHAHHLEDANARLAELKSHVHRELDMVSERVGIDLSGVTGIGTDFTDSFLSEVTALLESQKTTDDMASLKNRIDMLFDGRVGPAPDDQDALAECYAMADAADLAGLPPRLSKDSDACDYRSGGLIYKDRYSSFVAWQQLIAHTARNAVHHVVYVSADAQSDMWQSVPVDGAHYVEPNPSLVDEAITAGAITVFEILKPAQFLKIAAQDTKASGPEGATGSISNLRPLS